MTVAQSAAFSTSYDKLTDAQIRAEFGLSSPDAPAEGMPAEDVPRAMGQRTIAWLSENDLRQDFNREIEYPGSKEMTLWERWQASVELANQKWPEIAENEPAWGFADGFADIPTVTRAGLRAGTWLNENFVHDALWDKDTGLLEQHFQNKEQ